MLIYGLILTIPCVLMLMFPDRIARRTEQRITEGGDRFFEEQRTYLSYPLLRLAKTIRIFGAIGTLCGVALCIMQIYET